MKKFNFELNFKEAYFLLDHLQPIVNAKYLFENEDPWALDYTKIEKIAAESMYQRLPRPEEMLELLDNDLTFENATYFINLYKDYRFFKLTFFEDVHNIGREKVDQRLVDLNYIEQLLTNELYSSPQPLTRLEFIKSIKEYESKYFKTLLDTFKPEDYENLELFLIIDNISDNKLEEIFSHILNYGRPGSFSFTADSEPSKEVLDKLLMMNYIKAFFKPENSCMDNALEKTEKMFIETFEDHLNDYNYYEECFNNRSTFSKVPLNIIKELATPLYTRYKDKGEFKTFLLIIKNMIIENEI